LFGDVLEGDNFTGYANYGAFTASMAVRFPEVGYIGYANGSFATVDGFNCLRVTEGHAVGAGKLITPRSKVWWRGHFWFSSSMVTVAGANGNFFEFDYTADSNDFLDYTLVTYRIGKTPNPQTWMPLDGNSFPGTTFPATLASLKGRWVSSVTLTEPDKSRHWLDAVLVQDEDHPNFPDGYGLLAPYVNLGFGMASPDPTNNKASVRLFEYVDGDVYPNPYGLL
jgi:hypothetical protein